MEILSIYDPAFKAYGKVLKGYDTTELFAAMEAIPLPETGTMYAADRKSLENCAIFTELQNRAYGGMSIQLGMCWGHNTKLNALEYHRDSEINIGVHDFILLLAKREQIQEYRLDTSLVKAFRVPAGEVLEIYATTLHYAPCHVRETDGFRVAVALPRGTNTEAPVIHNFDGEDRLLFARNKWLLAHPESPEAKDGAWIGLTGENIDIRALLPQ